MNAQQGDCTPGMNSEVKMHETGKATGPDERQATGAGQGEATAPVAVTLLQPPRVLVVDDNVLNVELVDYVLTADGFVVDKAGDAEQALHRLRAFAPDLILMDIQMPGTDGLELTRQLKSDPDTASIVLVAFTAYAMKGDEARMLAAGCDGYLSKPINVGTFAAAVRGYLGREEPPTRVP